METIELRIGNIIDTVNRSNKIHVPRNSPLKVFEIQAFGLLAYDINKHPATLITMPHLLIEDVCGVPITGEWIVELGFEHVLFHFEYKDTSFQLFQRSEVTQVLMDGVKLCDIKYIHQLQNIMYCLTGEQLTLNDR